MKSPLATSGSATLPLVLGTPPSHVASKRAVARIEGFALCSLQLCCLLLFEGHPWRICRGIWKINGIIKSHNHTNHRPKSHVCKRTKSNAPREDLPISRPPTESGDLRSDSATTCRVDWLAAAPVDSARGSTRSRVAVFGSTNQAKWDPNQPNPRARQTRQDHPRAAETQRSFHFFLCGWSPTPTYQRWPPLHVSFAWPFPSFFHSIPFHI